MIPLAFPLPPACGKLRVPIQFTPADIAGRMSPQTLRALRGEIPAAWQPTVDALLAVADQTRVEPRVFGSLLWQRVTGLPYLSATSDLDLLWPVADLDCATRLVRRLAAIETDNPVRFDGEIISPDGRGVQWRELQRGPAEVLVKTSTGVQICPAHDLFPVATPGA